MSHETMPKNPPVEVQLLGQSIWLDFIRRRNLHNGDLARQIEHDGILGVTSNPSIFQKAIGGSDDYDAAIGDMLATIDAPYELYERLAVADIQAACDLFLPVYEATAGRDGYVSLEVSPLIANDTAKTIAEAQRLFATVDRPNVMIKIPATEAGLPAIEASIAAGVNINVTLIFSVENYVRVAEATSAGWNSASPPAARSSASPASPASSSAASMSSSIACWTTISARHKPAAISNAYR